MADFKTFYYILIIYCECVPSCLPEYKHGGQRTICGCWFSPSLDGRFWRYFIMSKRSVSFYFNQQYRSVLQLGGLRITFLVSVLITNVICHCWGETEKYFHIVGQDWAVGSETQLCYQVAAIYLVLLPLCPHLKKEDEESPCLCLCKSNKLLLNPLNASWNGKKKLAAS